MNDLVTNCIAKLNDETHVRAAQCVTHQKGLHATAAFILEVMGDNVVAST